MSINAQYNYICVEFLDKKKILLMKKENENWGWEGNTTQQSRRTRRKWKREENESVVGGGKKGKGNWEGRRRDMKRKTLNLLNLKEKLTKIFSYAELLSLKLKSDYQRVPYNWIKDSLYSQIILLLLQYRLCDRNYSYNIGKLQLIII